VKYGPVDVVVLATGEPRFEGKILEELVRLAGNGTIRVLDAMLLAVDEDGSRISLDIEDLDSEARTKLGFIETGTQGLFDAQDSEELWEGMVPGSAVVALAIENTWAVGLLNSLSQAGVEIALHTRVPAVIVNEALASLAE
jgi:hypothetical protein